MGALKYLCKFASFVYSIPVFPRIKKLVKSMPPSLRRVQLSYAKDDTSVKMDSYITSISSLLSINF